MPARLTVDFAARLNLNPVLEHDDASALQVAIGVKTALLSVPEAPTAFTQALGPFPGPLFQLMSAADQVVAPTSGGVNDAALAITEILSCLVAVDSTIFAALTVRFPVPVLAETFVTVNDVADGTVTLTCSGTAAVSIVVWVVSANVTAVCAPATPTLISQRLATRAVLTEAGCQSLCTVIARYLSEGLTRYVPMLSNFQVTVTV